MALDDSFALFQPLHEKGDKIGGMMAQLKAQAFLVFLALHASRAGN